MWIMFIGIRSNMVSFNMWLTGRIQVSIDTCVTVYCLLSGPAEKSTAILESRRIDGEWDPPFYAVLS